MLLGWCGVVGLVWCCWVGVVLLGWCCLFRLSLKQRFFEVTSAGTLIPIFFKPIFVPQAGYE